MNGKGVQRKRHSLRFQILAITVAAWLIPTVVLSYYILTVLPRLRERVTANLTLEADYARNAVAANIDSLFSMARDATYDGELLQAKEQKDTGILSSTEYVRRSRSYLERKYGREGLCLFAVYTPLDSPELLLYTQSGSAAMQAYRAGIHGALMEKAAGIDTRCVFLEDESGLYFLRNLADSRMNPFGVLVIAVNRDALFRPLEEVRSHWEGENAFRLRDGMAESMPALKEGLQETGDGQLVCAWRSENRDWTLDWELHISREPVYGELNRFWATLLILYLVLVPVVIAIGILAYRRVTKPLELLADASRRIEGGEFGLTVPMRGNDELGMLGKAFSGMSLRIKELIDKTYKEEIALRDSQIQALQSRINPHFINNALEDINWQARMDGSEQASRMVSALSVLLNATMANREKRVLKLREELEVADAYIFFAQERFGDRLTIRKEIEEATLEDELPLLTLQPVLENAMEHGIAPAGGGEILLKCAREGESLTITVVNGGKELDEEDRVRIDIALESGSTGNHVGLGNIAGRLKLIYHGQAGITVEKDEMKRTVARITIPQNRPKERRA